MVNILQESQSGRSILEYEKKTKNLTVDHRNSVIKIIVEEAISNQIQIPINDFSLLLNEIVWVLPSEKTVQVTKIVVGNLVIVDLYKSAKAPKIQIIM